ncbi:MAG: DUF1653 domain-containing protein [Minisyncoccia bacterium]
MKIPAKIPGKGFYYHYKHNPAGTVNNYAYELIGVAMHTEADCRPEDANLAIYLPIYESGAYRAGKFLDARPLEMFMENTTKENKTFPRFQKITDEKVITALQKIKGEMYP